MTKISGKTVLVTGGASGIGKLMAQRFLEKGSARAVIWDIDEPALEKVAEEFAELGYQVAPYQVDISNVHQVKEMSIDVLERFGQIDILVNNAGIVVGKDFVEHTSEDIALTLDINVKGSMLVTRQLLPAMISCGSGHIVNIASAAGMIPNPKMSVYAASKWAVLGWSESLRLELEQLDLPIRVSTITPGYIDTGMFEGVKAPILTPMLEPKEIVSQIIKAVERNRILVRAPKIVNLIPFLRGVLPTRIFDFTAYQLGVYDSMSEFRGRTESTASEN